MLGYFAEYWPIGYWSQWWPVYGQLVTPACRIYVMPAANRAYTRPADDRIYEVACG